MGFLFVSFNTFAIDKIDRETLDEALVWVDKYTLEKDFVKSTRYHFTETKFFAYEIKDGESVVKEYSYDEVMPMIKKSFEGDYSVSDIVDLAEEVTISSDGLTAKSFSESTMVMKYSFGKF